MTTKSDLKKEASVNASKFSKKADLASSISDIDDLDSDKLAVENDVIKKVIQYELVKNIDAIQTFDTSDSVKKLTITQ